MAFVPAQMLPQSRPLNRSLNRYTPTCATTTPAFPKKFTRRAVLTALAAAAGSLLAVDASNSESPSEKLQYRVVKSGSGPAAEVGDLVGIRFKGAYNGVVFDNLFENKTPYFYRVGSGAILKGLEEAVLLMRVGDVYDLDIPGPLAFGTKGRRASAGKPSIPGNATISYTIELTTIPGKEEELLERLDASDIGG